MRYLTIVSSVASLTIKSRYANVFVFIDCENNQFLNKIMQCVPKKRLPFEVKR